MTLTPVGHGLVAQRLMRRLRGMSLELPEDTHPVRTYASDADRANGAWSWFLLSCEITAAPAVGGHEPMGTLARAERLMVTRAHGLDGDLTVDFTEDLAAPAGEWIYNPRTYSEALYEPYPRES
jgi:hypothetical protein